ncbi:MAG TPA: SDR family oxidoreductase [Dehalococcoidia bacterium]|nr:SDR family oxidoreductase [Dehalococcoidia bacterium]
MDLKLKDKVALVTGTGSQIGYGKAIALTLAEEGCDIISADIDFEGAKKTATAVETLGRKALAVKVDVTERAEVDDMVQQALAKFGKIDILVNNAGASIQKPFMEMTKADWDFNINVNLYGQMNVAQAVLTHMIPRHYGRIINVSGGQGFPTISIYGAAKAGVVAFSQALAREVTHLGVIVNVVTPGLAKTGLTVNAPPEFLDDLIQHSSILKRFCTPEDMAPVVAFLASDVCSYMVGQCVNLGGS